MYDRDTKRNPISETLLWTFKNIRKYGIVTIMSTTSQANSLTDAQKKILDKAVKQTVKKYRKTLQLLAAT